MGMIGLALRTICRMNPPGIISRPSGTNVLRGFFGTFFGIVIVVVVIVAWKGYMSTIRNNFTDEPGVTR